MCTPVSPSKCTLYLNINKLSYNYVYKYKGYNRCKFSFSVSPHHASFSQIKWEQYLTLNISTQMIVPNTETFSFNAQTNELIVELEYREKL